MAKGHRGEALSATDIFDQLHGSSDSALVFTGLIDKADDDQSILFAHETNHTEWKKIPTSTIERVQFVRTIRGKDRTYPLAHIFLKAPQTDEGRAFAALAQLHRAASPVGRAPSVASSTFVEAAGFHPCPPGEILFYNPDKHRWECHPA